MNIVVFLGPSLDLDQAREILDAEYLPPASQGDIYLAAREKPFAIGLVDGYFQRVPSVWHKEILWALSRGIHVFGAASMGALRAAELSAFGMRGIGEVFQQFRSGALEDDDEVTIVHSDAENGYRPLSDAMVNIRATLNAARDENVISNTTTELLIEQAKQTFYPQRSYRALLENSDGVHDSAELGRLASWLPNAQVDQKGIDAAEMLRTICTMADSEPEPLRTDFRFQHTDAWEQVRRQIHMKQLSSSPGAENQQGDALLTELRLAGQEFLIQRQNALLHSVCQELTDANGESVDTALVPAALNDFRLRNGLEAPESVEPWLASQDMDLETLGKLLVEELMASRVQSLLDGEVEKVLIQQLRMSGSYSELKSRAQLKQKPLSERGLTNPHLRNAGFAEDDLWAWYFKDCLGIRSVVDVDDYAIQLGFGSRANLRREVLREWFFRKYEPLME